MPAVREAFIDSHRAMFWYTPEDRKADISDELMVETTLNDGTMADYYELRDILTPQRMAKVFFTAVGRKQNNYYPEIRHFFSLLLKPYLLPTPPTNDEIKSKLTEIAIAESDILPQKGGAK